VLAGPSLVVWNLVRSEMGAPAAELRRPSAPSAARDAAVFLAGYSAPGYVVWMERLLALWANPTVRSAASVFVAAALLIAAIRLVRGALQRRIQDTDLRYRANKLVGFVGYLLVVVLVFVELSGRFSGVTVALGAASAGIAFALQEVIVSGAGWLALALGGYYKVGDRVQLGGIKGDVIDIGLIRTTVMEIGGWVNGDLYSGRIVRIANSFVFKEPVFNYSGDFPFVWDEVTVPIKYGSDYDEARKILQTVAEEIVGEEVGPAKQRWSELVRAYRIEDARVEPLVTLIANDNWVELTLRYVVGYQARRITKDRLFSRILREIEGSGGRVGLASMTVQLVEMPSVRVSLEGRIGARPNTPE
jgi:small-conductance mechanosensitive channel